MSRVRCSINETVLENEDGIDVDSIIATCSRCGHETESFGIEDASVRRCLVLMREECPNREKNYYVNEDSMDG